MTKDLERAVHRERDEQKAKDKKMHEFERERAAQQSSLLSQNVRIEKENLQRVKKAKLVGRGDTRGRSVKSP